MPDQSSTKPSTFFRKVQETVLRQSSYSEVHTTNFFLQRDVLPRNTSIKARQQQIKLDRDTVMVFADDMPLANWAHPCRYLLHDAESGELYRTVDALFPPYMDAKETPRTYIPFHQPIKYADLAYYPVRPRLELRWPIRWGNRYAILFSGDSNNRHTNDLEFLYRTLRGVYGVPAANIYVLNYDGTLNYSGGPQPATTWPGDNTAYQMPVNAAGSKTELNNALDDLKKRLKANDSLLIHTNNHGTTSGSESVLCCYGADYLASDFAAKLAELPKFRCLIVMMEQCFAGGFNQPIINNSPAGYTSVASAAIATQTSIGGAHFDPFARDWIAAMAGADPYGNTLVSDPDTDNNGTVTAAEAYNYADSIHHPHDTPNFSVSSNGARGCHLGISWAWIKFPIYYEVFRQFEPIWERVKPEEFYRRVEAALPELEKLADEYEPEYAALDKMIVRRASAIIRRAGQQRK
ncbi:MAG: hypothetical protein K8L91_00995 [Anaerolineae bacterium]|nr:hypothetical protein [Anaerolineae bacterium]